MNSADYLDALRVRLNLPSDYALAARLGESKTRLSNYRTGKQQMSDDLIPKVAQLLSIDPLVVAADVYASRATSGFARELFERFGQLARTASAAGPALAASPVKPRRNQVVGRLGLEPRTNGLKVRCSTD